MATVRRTAQIIDVARVGAQANGRVVFGATLDLADIIHCRVTFHQHAGPFDQGTSLALLAANGQQRHARGLDTDDTLGVDRGHVYIMNPYCPVPNLAVTLT